MDASPVVETAALAWLLLHVRATPPAARMLVEEDVDICSVAAVEAGRVGGRQAADAKREQRQQRDEEQHLGCSKDVLWVAVRTPGRESRCEERLR